MSTTTAVRLTDEQQAAVETLCRLDRQVATLGGFAGSGKSTVIAELVQRLRGAAVCAYTGKAAQVLRRKGVEASTIHSLIYVYRDGGFDLADELDCRCIIVDEASMVGLDIHSDLQSFGLPIIYVGDHGQLEPVGSAGFNLMAEPQVRLETIHRNAGGIAMFANFLREGGSAADWRDHYAKEKDAAGQVVVMRSDEIDQVDVTSMDQLICAYNKTRVTINSSFREQLGRDSDLPQVGDRVICRQNDRGLRVFNGMQGTIAEVSDRTLVMESDNRLFRCPYVKEAFNSESKPPYRRGVIPFDYAYCVTCHSAQGDEWDRVMVLEQRCDKWDMKKWRYTSASRARHHLTWRMSGVAMTLVEISEDLLALDAAIEEAAQDGGEITDAVAKMLDDWFVTAISNRDLKLDNYAALIREKELRASARQAELDRLAVRVRVDENQAKYLKRRLFEFLEMHKMLKVETKRYKLTVCNNGGVLPLDMPEDPASLPKAYQIETVVVKADTETIRKDLDAGVPVDGCRLLPRGKHLRIK